MKFVANKKDCASSPSCLFVSFRVFRGQPVFTAKQSSVLICVHLWKKKLHKQSLSCLFVPFVANLLSSCEAVFASLRENHIHCEAVLSVNLFTKIVEIPVANFLLRSSIRINLVTCLPALLRRSYAKASRQVCGKPVTHQYKFSWEIMKEVFV